ncbi:GPR1/FUN34/yaaH family-domain-containing protein [Aspergillus similis]
MADTTVDHASHLEKGLGCSLPTFAHLDRTHTAGGHVNDRSQPGLPVVHRTFANPSPLGLLSFATGIFLISTLGLHARGVETPNVLLGVLIFFGGLGQFLAAVMEPMLIKICVTVRRNPLGSYSAFNFSYAMIYIPGTGILAAYTDAKTGALSPEFNQAVAIYLWAWFIVNTLYVIAAVRSSWVLFIDLGILSLGFLLLAVAYMTGDQAVMTAGYSVTMVTAALSYWAGCAGLWAGGTTPINLPMFPMYKEFQ